MNPHAHSYLIKRTCTLGLVVGIFALSAGCNELHLAVDGLLGKQEPVVASAGRASTSPMVMAKNDAPKPPAVPTTPVQAKPPAAPASPVEAKPQPQAAPQVEAKPQAPPAPPAEPPKASVEAKPSEQPPTEQVKPAAVAQVGKKRPPGFLSPAAQAPEEKGETKTGFKVDRDPFKQPTEILPTECPPSMPLCRFDRSQLKLVGIIQVNEGQIKGMVEDPDGRGYYVTPGMQIGGGAAVATITQITNKGITLHVHRTKQDVLIPLFSEPTQGEKF